MSKLHLPQLLRQLVLCSALLCLSLLSSAQITRGDFYFDAFEYGLALEAYEFAYNEQNVQNPFLSRKLALTYRMLGDMDQSRLWYAKTLHRDKSNPIDMLYYAEALKFNQEYKEALRWYKKYSKLVPDDRRAVYHTEDLEYVHELCRDSIYYDVIELEMNTDNPEFGISKYKSSYLISSLGVVNPEMGDKYLDAEDEQSMYLDVYKFSRQENNELKVEDWEGGAVNTRYHDGPVSYDSANKELFITRNNVKKGKPVLDAKGKVNLKLFVSKEVGGVFQEASEIGWNSDDYSNAHPSVSKDGKTLYFASNRDGGQGGTDLFYATRLESGGWNPPQNLGSTINTEGDEVFPYIHDDGSLYFSSTGHAGLGGLDIFRVKKTSGKWSKPINIGASVNSHRDDFGLVLDDGVESGYFSSNRNSETVDDDVFYFKYEPTITIRGKVYDDKDLTALDNAAVRLYDMDGTLVFEQRTDMEGYYDFDIKPNQCSYRLEISSGKEYSVESYPIEHCDRRLSLYDMGETVIGKLTYLAAGVILEKETAQPMKGFRVTLYDVASGEELRTLYTEHDGRLQFSLSAETDYKVSFQKEGWFAKSAEFTTKGMAPGIVEIEKYVSLLFEKIVAEKPIVVENIFYDYNKYFVREDAKLELDKIAKMMQDNPNVTIELSSHTDSQGGDKYNLALSDFRAKSAVEYIINQGVDNGRVVSKGYGEKAIRNRCENGVDCGDKEHEFNRRTEFKVLKF